MNKIRRIPYGKGDFEDLNAKNDVAEIMDYYASSGVFPLDRQEAMQVMRQWYGGYRFAKRASTWGDENPWISLLKFRATFVPHTRGERREARGEGRVKAHSAPRTSHCPWNKIQQHSVVTCAYHLPTFSSPQLRPGSSIRTLFSISWKSP